MKHFKLSFATYAKGIDDLEGLCTECGAISHDEHTRGKAWCENCSTRNVVPFEVAATDGLIEVLSDVIPETRENADGSFTFRIPWGNGKMRVRFDLLWSNVREEYDVIEILEAQPLDFHRCIWDELTDNEQESILFEIDCIRDSLVDIEEEVY